MAIKLNSLKSNLDRERNGDWISLPETGDPDLAFKVRGINHPEYEMARDREIARLNQRYGSDKAPPEERVKILGKMLSDHILMDWKGLADDDGKPIPYTRELAEELLTDAANEVLRGYVITAAQRITEVKVEFTKAAVKNSATPSGRN